MQLILWNVKSNTISLFSCSQQFWQPGLQPSTSQDVKPFPQPYPGGVKSATAVSAIDGSLQTQHPWEGRSIATQKFRLVEFSAYLDVNTEDNVRTCLIIHKRRCLKS